MLYTACRKCTTKLFSTDKLAMCPRCGSSDVLTTQETPCAGPARRQTLRLKAMQALSGLQRDRWLQSATIDNEEERQRLVAAAVALLNALRDPADSNVGDGASPPAEPPTLIPDYQPEDGRWISSREAARIERIKVSALAAYRKKGNALYVAHDKMSGIDKYGRIWRRFGTPMSWPLYYKPSLKNSQEDFS